MELVTPDRLRRSPRRAKHLRALGALLVAAAWVPAPAAAQSDNAIMRSQIVDAITVQNDADMDFGDIIGAPPAPW